MATRLAHHVLHRLSEPTFLSHLTTTADHLSTLLDRLPKLFPSLINGPIRGRGFIRGIPFDIATSPDAPGEVVRRARERGLLLLTAGSDAVRLIPSLIVTKEECDFASGVIESVLAGMVQDGWGEGRKRA
jgi:acetylornithine aminotransferase